MLISFVARYVCNACSYLYPAYASYKALSLPASTPEADVQIERWLQYWAVVGTWTAVESMAGWLFVWIPFYSLVKTGILLAMSLPQTEASTYVYQNHLAPLFARHERDIDTFLAGLRGQAADVLSGGAVWLWNKIRDQMAIALPQASGQRPTGSGPDAVGGPGPTFAPAPPTLQDPASGPAQAVYGFMTRYAAQYMPVALTALQAAAVSASNAASRATSSSAPLTGSIPQAQGYDVGGAGRRSGRAPYESGMDVDGNERITMPVPVPTPPPNTHSSSDSTLRSRTFMHAMGPSSSRENLGVSSSRQGMQGVSQHPRSVSSPSSSSAAAAQYRSGSILSTHSSEESIQTRSSRSSMMTSGGGPEASYVDVRREDSYDESGSHPAGYPVRPGGGAERRRSSWFGWGAGGGSGVGPAGQGGSPSDRPKAE